jgi:hypothetical protein
MKAIFWKPAFGVFVIMATIISFSGCDLFDKAKEITFSADLDVTWEADENADGTNVGYAFTKTVSLSDNAEIAKYINKVKSIKVESVTYKVTDYNDDPHGEAVIFKEGTASFSSKGSSSPILEVPFAATADGVNLKTTTSDTNLTIDAGGLNDIAAIFKKEKEADMKVSGKLSRTPVAFKLVSTFHVKITAEVID